MHSIEQFDLSALPDHAQEELYDFYLFLRQRYEKAEKTAARQAARERTQQRMKQGYALGIADTFKRDSLYE